MYYKQNYLKYNPIKLFWMKELNEMCLNGS